MGLVGEQWLYHEADRNLLPAVDATIIGDLGGMRHGERLHRQAHVYG